MENSTKKLLQAYSPSQLKDGLFLIAKTLAGRKINKHDRNDVAEVMHNLYEFAGQLQIEESLTNQS
jgi:hypothetical protein